MAAYLQQKENDAKLMRARNKAFREREAIHLKESEISVLHDEQNQLQDELNRLMAEVNRYSRFHDFLKEVMQEAGGYDEPRSVMTRHKTLVSLLVNLRCKEKLRNAMVETFRRHMATYREELEDKIMLQHNQVSKLQKKLEQVQARKLYWENEYSNAITTASEKTMLEGKLRLAARNLYVIVRTRMQRPFSSEDFCEQMTHVHNYMIDLTNIISELKREAILEARREAQLKEQLLQQQLQQEKEARELAAKRALMAERQRIALGKASAPTSKAPGTPSTPNPKSPGGHKGASSLNKSKSPNASKSSR